MMHLTTSSDLVSSAAGCPPRRAADRISARARLAPAPGLVPMASRTAVSRAVEALHEAAAAHEPAERYAAAHVAALRGAAALIAARSVPGGRRRKPRSAWVQLLEVAPEFGPWATHFASGAATRAAAAAGSQRAVSEHDALAWAQEAERFVALVEESLGLAAHLPIHPTAGLENGAGVA